MRFRSSRQVARTSVFAEKRIATAVYTLPHNDDETAKTLAQGGIHSRRASEKKKGSPAGLGPLGKSAGTQAEDALTMKKAYVGFL